MYKNFLHAFLFKKIITRKKIHYRRFSNRINAYYNLYNRVNYNTIRDLPYQNDFINEKIADSEFALQCVNEVAASAPDEAIGPVPKKIWMYWDTGLENCPDLVKKSYDSWVKMNPEYEVVFLCNDNLKDKLGFNLNDIFYTASVDAGVAMKADILRLYLLKKFGGIWVDTTTFCLQPLSDWFEPDVKETGFFLFRHRENKTRPGEAWVIASQQNGMIVSRILNHFLTHLFKPRDVTLYVSNRIKMVGLSHEADEKYGLDEVTLSETKYFMPYFSVGYFINEAVKSGKAAEIWARLESKNNNHTINNDPFEMFKQSFVSKQTYKRDYLQSSIYKERIAHLASLTDKL